MTPGQRRKQEWVSGLATLRPDLVIDTGDNLSHAASVPVVRDSLGPLLDAPGVFVFGSNDYFSPTLRNPLRYLLPDDGRRNTYSAKLPWSELRDAFTASGWVDLTNRREVVKVGELSFAFAGVDDPHLRYDRLADVAGPADAERRRPARRRARAVPPGPRPVRRRRVRRDPGRPHPRRPGLPARRRRADHELRPRARPRQGPAPAPGRLAGRRPGLRLAARLGRDRHLAVRPDPGGLPPGGHPAHPGARGPLTDWGTPLPLRYAPDLVSPAHVRAVAQLGSAPRSGRGGRRFKSCQPDSSGVGSRSLCGREPSSCVRVCRTGRPADVDTGARRW